MIIEIIPVGLGFNIDLSPESDEEEKTLRASKVIGHKGIDIILDYWGDTEPNGKMSHGMKVHFVCEVIE